MSGFGVFKGCLQAEQGSSGLCIKDLMVGKPCMSSENLELVAVPVAYPASSCICVLSFLGPICEYNYRQWWDGDKPLLKCLPGLCP